MNVWTSSSGKNWVEVDGVWHRADRFWTGRCFTAARLMHRIWRFYF